jgi:Icc-related predicted phosphoesterase
VHESTGLTGSWQDKIGETVMFNPAHHKPELSVIRFDPRNASKAERVIL